VKTTNSKTMQIMIMDLRVAKKEWTLCENNSWRNAEEKGTANAPCGVIARERKKIILNVLDLHVNPLVKNCLSSDLLIMIHMLQKWPKLG